MRTFVLCPQEEAERKQRAIEHFTERRLGVEFVNPLHAVTAGLRTTQTYEVDDPGSGYVMGPKPVGIWLAHWSLWYLCQFFQERHFMILEADALFPERWFERLQTILQTVPPDYDFLFIGNCCTKDKPTKQINGDIYEVQWPACLHAYIVAQKVLPLLTTNLRRVWAPIDLQLGFEIFPRPDVKCYCVLPRIVEQFNYENLPV